MNKTVLPLFLLVLLFSTARAQDSDYRPLITVSGQAEILVVPDEAVFNLRVVTFDKDLLAATARNDTTVKKVMALARRFQVPPERIKTDYISLDERYSSEELTKKPSVFLGYDVTKKVVIVLRDVSKTEELLAEIFKSGVTRIDGVSFRSAQIRKYQDQARAQAIKAAQEKARSLATEIGQTIGKAYSITEEGVRDSSMANTSNNFLTNVGGSYSDVDSTIALGQISITARVLVSFELK